MKFVLECDYFNGRTIDVDGGLSDVGSRELAFAPAAASSFGELAVLVHLGHDVAAADELPAQRRAGGWSASSE